MRALVFIAAAMLASCAASPWEQWHRAASGYNAVISQLVSARAACVATPEHPEYGADHPACLVSDAAYVKIEPARASVRQCLDDADAALQADRDGEIDAYIDCAIGGLAALSQYIGGDDGGE